MRVGTKSLLFGVHQFLWHPLTVILAWRKLYGWPSARETVCILVHDWGYWKAADMDGEWGMNHAELGAKIAGSLFGDAYYDLVLLHSRRLARELGATPSKLCWADKASILFEPEWFYLLRARASGELAEYRDKAAWQVRIEESDGKWFKWLKRDLAKAALAKARCPFLDGKDAIQD
jgi:hypothetical protein